MIKRRHADDDPGIPNIRNVRWYVRCVATMRDMFAFLAAAAHPFRKRLLFQTGLLALATTGRRRLLDPQGQTPVAARTNQHTETRYTCPYKDTATDQAAPGITEPAMASRCAAHGIGATHGIGAAHGAGATDAAHGAGTSGQPMASAQVMASEQPMAAGHPMPSGRPRALGQPMGRAHRGSAWHRRGASDGAGATLGIGATHDIGSPWHRER